MAEVQKIATRESYGKALVALGHAQPALVVLDADLSEATKTAGFAEAFPDRFFNCGIAECNMMAVAAGLASCGLVPFASTFAMFAAGRAFEQVRNSIGYPHLNVKIGATHGGISVGEDGASHQCAEDFALMRAIPGMVVICPADDVEARAAVAAAYAHEGPVYLRFGRLATPVFHAPESYGFSIGKGELLRPGTHMTIIANGLLVYEALQAATALAAQGIDARVINMATIKPLDEAMVLAAARETGRILTCEEHNIIGGLGEAVCALTAGQCPVSVMRLGINDEFGHSGPAPALLQQFGLCAEGIVRMAAQLMQSPRPTA
ncbi:MAG: transketolase family protein [Oscillospiraceae bacterium]